MRTRTLTRQLGVALAGALLACAVIATRLAAQQEGRTDPWVPVRGFAGELVLRQFHQEGFVNLYVLNAQASTPAKLVFESESFENFSNRWRARETYEILSRDEFVETFELAPPAGGYQVYSRNHLRRVRK